MTHYKLEIIPGTAEYVLEELNLKHPDSVIKKTKKKSIEFESNEDDIDTFNDLLSVLRIEKENGLIRNLFRREWRKYTSPAGVNPALAYILCIVSEVNEKDKVIDPFCGGGTIALTAAVYFNPEKVFASDISGNAVDMTSRNAGEINKMKIVKLNSKNFVVFRSNVSQLKLQEGSVNKIISNLPFGIRSKSHDENIKIYREFEIKANKLLSSGDTVTVLTQEKDLIQNTFNKHFRIKKEFDVDQGGLIPKVFVFEKK